MQSLLHLRRCDRANSSDQLEQLAERYDTRGDFSFLRHQVAHEALRGIRRSTISVSMAMSVARPTASRSPEELSLSPSSAPCAFSHSAMAPRNSTILSSGTR